LSHPAAAGEAIYPSHDARLLCIEQDMTRAVEVGIACINGISNVNFDLSSLTTNGNKNE
jgi:hypothetical protein